MATSIVDQFLSAYRATIEENNGVKLQQLMLIEDPLPPMYQDLSSDLRQSFPHPLTHLVEQAKRRHEENPRPITTAERKFMPFYVAAVRAIRRKIIKFEDLGRIEPPIIPRWLEIISDMLKKFPLSSENGDEEDNQDEDEDEAEHVQDNQDEVAQDSQYEDAEDSQYKGAQDNQDELDQDGRYDNQDEWNQDDRYEEAPYNQDEMDQDGQFEDPGDNQDGRDGDSYYEDAEDEDSEVEDMNYVLLDKCQTFLPGYQEISDFVTGYFVYLRDVYIYRLDFTHPFLQSVLSAAVAALGCDIGLVFLPTVISFSRTLARWTIDVDKQPELAARIARTERIGSNEEARERVTLVEGAANAIKEALDVCLGIKSGSSSGIDSKNQPEGRRAGIYIIANICLKLFFYEKKIRSAEKIFENIDQESPRLALFPAAQRVTYLYYLGRYYFANSHFFRAQLTLQAAYDQCHSRCLKQRRLILIYLIASNIILGRFPSLQLLQRPEAFDLWKRFLPLCQTLAKGDLASFRRLFRFDDDNENAQWFFRRRILLQLRNRCEVIIWRSLARRTFLISAFEDVKANPTKTPTLDLDHLLTVANYLESKARFPDRTNGDENSDFVSPDVPAAAPNLLTMPIIESTVGSLVQQDLMQGYISHRYHRFAITGSGQTSALQAGFPGVWQILSEKADREVPGWVQEEGKSPVDEGAAKPERGMAVHLGGVEPVEEPPVEVDQPSEVDEMYE